MCRFRPPRPPAHGLPGLLGLLLFTASCSASDPFNARPPGTPAGDREMGVLVLQTALDNFFREEELEDKRVICIGVTRKEPSRSAKESERRAHQDPPTRLLERLRGPRPLVPLSHCERDSNLAERHIESGERAMGLILGRFRMTGSDRAEVHLTILDRFQRRRRGTCELVRTYGEWVVNACSPHLGG